MTRKIEYRNEFGLIFSIVNGIRKTYQDMAEGSYTWINIWIDEKLVGSIETKQGRLILNLLPKEPPNEITLISIEQASVVSIPF